MGGDDAKWYTAVVADFLEQWRLGFWPVFVGQTRFAAPGTVVPVRVAPFLQHLTLAIDTVTGRSLSPYFLLNLAIVTSCVAGGLSAYFCLRRIIPEFRAVALLLSVIYVWSPATIGLPYTGQLFMSVTTLPFLPLAFLGVVEVESRENFSGWAFLAAGCAGCWICHSPIGLWVTILCALATLVVLLQRRRWRIDLARAALSGGLFFCLSGYVFVSAANLTPPKIAHTPRSSLIENVHNTFPAVLLPVTRDASQVTDLQPGWALLALIALCVPLSFIRRAGSGRALSVAAIITLLLALPVPLLNPLLWGLAPHAVIDVTNAAPTQRLYAVLAACGVVLGARVIACFPKVPSWLFAGLLGAAAWSGWELRPFVHRGHLIANSRAQSEAAMRPENLLLSRYSLALLNYDNGFFSSGVMDYSLEQRVLEENMGSYIETDVDAIAPGFDFGKKVNSRVLSGAFFGSSPPNEHVWVTLEPKLTLLPGRHYLLALQSTSPDRLGILTFRSTDATFIREYSLPESGMRFAFGIRPLNSWVIPLSTSTSEPVELAAQFINQNASADMDSFSDFARYELISYDPNALPIQLKSFLPLTTELSSPKDGWLETFRAYTPGWTATVNGEPALVHRTQNGLAAVRIPRGRSVVRLIYIPSASLLLSYWLMAASWAVLASIACVGAIRAGLFSSAGAQKPITVPPP